MSNRIKYLDVAKFIGIFCIYLGHFGENAGKAYLFVFSFHVALFFFLSGCAETLSTDVSCREYIFKNIKSLLIPSYFFSLAVILTLSISSNTRTGIVPYCIRMLKGNIRNQGVASSLWFLTCLFVTRIAFYFLRRLLKFKSLILIVCLGLFIGESLFGGSPSIVYNVDSACYYIVFYALGYCFYGSIRRLFALDSPLKRFIFGGGYWFVQYMPFCCSLKETYLVM